MTLLGKRILVVEDEAMLSIMIEEMLEDMGCVVAGTASRLQDGVEQARTIVIDAAVLDINLAGELSYPIADVLIEREIPFLFATGYGSRGLTGALQSIQVLTKPFRQEHLQSALVNALLATPLEPKVEQG